MPVLTSQQRSSLEKTIIQARKLAETGARNALHSRAVDHPEPFSHMSPDERALRNRLRNKGRLLGDDLTTGGSQQVNHLAYELAYEYWHKMLFARFLEANGLLMHPDGVPVTLADCEELAPEEGFPDKWTLAAYFASKMLPAIFRVEDPLMAVEFAPNDRINLETLLDSIEEHIFSADDSLGWVYQFWQSEAKASINASGDKINGEKLPAVTQLFTEPYMVHFLIDNTLGAWWVSRNVGISPPVNFEYLRFSPPPSGEAGRGLPAAGTFPGWPEKTAAITALDPCMGSGHFIVSLFNVFVVLRMFEEGLTKEEATDRVISENLHGLEIDPRCTQIAAFNLALTAWKFCGYYRPLPEMNLACSGIAPAGKKEDWVKLVGKVADPVEKARMENGMQLLYSHFQLAPELGSLLDPSTIRPDAFIASFNQLKPVLMQALAEEKDSDQLERGVMAAGIAKAGEILSRKFTLQITNVPYLSRGKQDKILADYGEKHFPEAKGDLATVFLEKMLKSCVEGGIACSVIPQNWLFLTSYRKFREKLLKNETWNVVARLGAKGFQTPMWDFNVMLIALSHQKPIDDHQLLGLDVSDASNAASKDEALKSTELKTVNQKEQLGNPDAAIILGNIDHNILKLGSYAEVVQGVGSTDAPKYIFRFWEIENKNLENWQFYQMAPNGPYISGATSILRWENGEGDLAKIGTALKGLKIVGRPGVAVAVNQNPFPAPFFKNRFDCTTAVIIPIKEEHLRSLYAFLFDQNFKNKIRQVDQALSITESSFEKVPFDVDYWQKVAAEKYPHGLPKPYSDDLTQWLFHGHPAKAEHPLQVALARLLGYRWPAESDTEMELSVEARQLIKEIEPFNTLTDDDGIVCIPSVNGELAASERLRTYLQAIWGQEYDNHTVANLLTQEGSRLSNLDDWLREEFFSQHFKVFQNRPFIWHIWDGRKDGFAALVNYHKLNKGTLQRLIYTYLGDWIRQCENKRRAGESGAEGLLSAAQQLREKLLLIQQGEAPYDIFIRWKKFEEQPIGWDPDLNDGVRLNIRPFLQANVLRKKPNIKYGIDRGKNPPGSPWGEIRDNDKHLTLEEKRKARECDL